MKHQQMQPQQLQKRQNKNIIRNNQIYTNNCENDKRAGKYKKKQLDRFEIDKEGSLEWLRKGQLNRDGEKIIINAQDYTNGF